MDYCFSAKNPGFPRKCGRKFLAHQVVVYLKPPGSLQYVEKCLTETVYRETNPKFSTKVSQFSKKFYVYVASSIRILWRQVAKAMMQRLS